MRKSIKKFRKNVKNTQKGKQRKTKENKGKQRKTKENKGKQRKTKENKRKQRKTKENKGKQRKTKDRRKTKIGGDETEEQKRIRLINERLAKAFKEFSSGPDHSYSYRDSGEFHPADG